MVNVEDDRIVGVEPFERDPRLSPLTDSITEALHADNRVARPLRLSSSSAAGGAFQSNAIERVRRAIGEANRQMANARNYREAPGLTVIAGNRFLGADEEQLLSACFGDRVYRFPVSQFEDGELILSRNGVLAPTKNTSTSAVMLFAEDGDHLLILNPFAKCSVQAEWLGVRTACILDDGTITTK